MVKKVGNNGNNVLTGTASADQLYGQGGNDTLNGLGGNDKLYGGNGNDKLNGGNGNDLAQGGAGNDVMNGGNGNDKMYGGSGNDKMNGGAGKDHLYAGPNSGTPFSGDTMTGGAGDDSFHFAGNVGRTTITDFQDNQDTLYLSRAYFQNIEDLSGGAVTAANMTVDDILTYYASSSGGDSAIDLSGNGADAPRIILNGVDNAFNLSNDIVLI